MAKTYDERRQIANAVANAADKLEREYRTALKVKNNPIADPQRRKIAGQRIAHLSHQIDLLRAAALLVEQSPIESVAA